LEPGKYMTAANDEAPSLTLSQVKGIIARGRWWILLAMCASALGSIAVAYLLPARFTSEATLLVVQQQVPERYVTPTSTLSIADELQAMTQEVLSRRRLLELIDRFGIYAKERQRLAPEEVITLMRKYIEIEPLETVPGAPPAPGGKTFNAFKISFSAEKAILAQEVTSQLTSLFIQENLKVREDQANTTTNFLDERVDAAKKRLAEQEERLRDFKMQNLGTLPEQQSSNLAILSSAQAQLQNTTASLDRARQQRAYLESLLEAYRRLASRGVSPPVLPSRPETPVIDEPILALQRDLTRLQIERARLLTIYRENYPDVVDIEREISAKQASLESLKPAKLKADPLPDDSSAATTVSGRRNDTPSEVQHGNPSPESAEDTSIAQVKSQLESNRLEIENLSTDENQRNAAISEYQSRLNLTPVREQQLSGILRDYELSQKEYQDLLGKEQQSQLAMSLEKRQGGQQFRLAESPSLPTLPSSPKRLKISLGGAAGGFLLGLVLAVLAEMKNPKIYDENEVNRRFSVPLVVGLPLLLAPAEARLRRWTRLFEWLGGSALTVGVLAAEYFVYLHP
jgi:succinoglycan biosynthesis transport protein ExoP